MAMALAGPGTAGAAGLSYKTVAVTAGVSEAIAQGLATGLGGDVETLTVEDLLHVRVQDFEEAVNTLVVDGLPATAIQEGAASKLVRRIAEVGAMPPLLLVGCASK